MFGAFVPERNPRTRSARAVKLRLLGDLGSRNAMHAEYRYYRDTWEIESHTAELGYSRYFGEAWLADVFARYYTQTKALFYFDNAQSETTYVSRNRQLSDFNDEALGAKLSYTVKKVPGRYDQRQAQRHVRVHALQVQGLHRRPHRQPLRLQRQHRAAVRVGHLLGRFMFGRCCLLIAAALVGGHLAGRTGR